MGGGLNPPPAALLRPTSAMGPAIAGGTGADKAPARLSGARNLGETPPFQVARLPPALSRTEGARSRPTLRGISAASTDP
jgi:hypothetical protein